MKKETLIILGGIGLLIWWLKNKPTQTAVEPVANPSVNSIANSPVPFALSKDQTINIPQISPTPATVLSPKQLMSYNDTGIISSGSVNRNIDCNPCKNLAGGINKQIYVC
jgi:hypothetical protein